MLISRMSTAHMLDHVIYSYPQISIQSFSIAPLFSAASPEIQQPRAHQTPTSLQIPSAAETERARERKKEERMQTLTSTSSFLNPPTLITPSKTRNPSISAISPFRTTPSQRSRTTTVSCDVALKQDSPTAAASTSSSQESEASPARIGAKVKVKTPLKVYHVPKVPEVDLLHMEGTIKQYAGLWKGKRISANLPFKVEFFAKVEGRDDPVKFFAHLKEDEFDYLD